MYGVAHSSEKRVAFLEKTSKCCVTASVIPRRWKSGDLLNLNLFAQCRTHARIGAHWLLQLHSQLARSTYFRSLTSRSSFMNQDTNVNEEPAKNIAEMTCAIASF